MCIVPTLPSVHIIMNCTCVSSYGNSLWAWDCSYALIMFLLSPWSMVLKKVTVILVKYKYLIESENKQWIKVYETYITGSHGLYILMIKSNWLPCSGSVTGLLLLQPRVFANFVPELSRKRIVYCKEESETSKKRFT